MDKIPTTMVHSGPNDTDCNIYLKQFKSGHYVYVAALTSSPKGVGATEEVNYCSIKKLSNSFICLFFRFGGIPAKHKDENLLIFLGIIDILQSYR